MKNTTQDRLWEELVAKQDEVIRMREELLNELTSTYSIQKSLIAKLLSENTDLKSKVESLTRQLRQLEKMSSGPGGEDAVTSGPKASQAHQDDKEQAP